MGQPTVGKTSKTFTLDSEANEKLSELAELFGSDTRALDFAINFLASLKQQATENKEAQHDESSSSN